MGEIPALRYEIKMLWFLVESQGVEGDPQLVPDPIASAQDLVPFRGAEGQGQKRRWRRRQGGGKTVLPPRHLHNLLWGQQISWPHQKHTAHKVREARPPLLHLCPTPPEPSLQPSLHCLSGLALGYLHLGSGVGGDLGFLLSCFVVVVALLSLPISPHPLLISSLHSM